MRISSNPVQHRSPKAVAARLTRVAAMVMGAALMVGCAVAASNDPVPSPSATQGGPSTDASATAAPTTAPATQSGSGAQPASTEPASTLTPAATATTSASAAGTAASGGAKLWLPERFGDWTLVESRAAAPWTVAAYTQATTGAPLEVSASKAPEATFEQVVAQYIGPDAKRVPTGAVCGLRSGVAGCVQEQDGLTVVVTSPKLTTEQVAAALGQLLSALR